MPQVSVIIPVYKVEKYLAACLDSVLNQTFTDWEAICVNDGSPDRCGEILAQFVQKDPRIKVVTQKNQGVSVARNEGLKNSKGDFICFLDSDDLLHPDFLKILLENIQKHHIKVIGADFKVFTGTYSGEPLPQKISVKYYKSPLLKYLLRQMKYNAMVCGKLYHQSIFQDLCFDPDLCYGEDTHLSLQILSKIDSIAFVSAPLYAYRQSENSLTRSPFNQKMADDHILSSLKLNDYFKEYKISKLTAYLIRKKLANRCFRWTCLRPYRKDKANYRAIWKKYIPVFNNLISQKKFNPFDFFLFFLYV